MPTTSQQHRIVALRAQRTRARIRSTLELPRLSVFRSLRHIYAQIIDDKSGKTIVSCSDHGLDKGNKTETAKAVGNKIADLAKAKKVKAVRFDRGPFKYHGRVAALATGARENGLII
ncbi:50S ribosomal protein L18 [Patescibacteria group bacterium]|nr:50S ribosomal protein L18 [Patescibacteria group bacterium]